MVALQVKWKRVRVVLYWTEIPSLNGLSKHSNSPSKPNLKRDGWFGLFSMPNWIVPSSSIFSHFQCLNGDYTLWICNH